MSSPTESMTLGALREEDIARRAEDAGEPDWLRDRRLSAYKTWADQEWPKVRGDEYWKDTPFTRFSVDVPLIQDGAADTVASPLLDDLELSARVDLVDGQVRISGSADGLTVVDLAEAAASHEDLVRQHLSSQTAEHDRTVTANEAAWTHGVLVHIADDTRLAAPVGISLQANRPGAHLPRILVVVGRHVEAGIYLEHVSADLDEVTTVDEVTEIIVGDGSQVDLVSVQDWSGQVGHMALQAAELGRDSQMRHLAVTIGGQTVRMRPEIHLVGPGATIEPLGVYFSDQEQHFEHHPFIEHIAPHGTSDVLYKGALQGRSRTVFRGHIFVHKEAVGSDSNEVNKSMILSPGSRADSTPFLEIQCSEITAGHGSATGQIDREHLFYLRSRGIPTEEALRLIVFGFFTEVLDRIDDDDVRGRAMEHIRAEIDRADLTSIAQRSQSLPTTPGGEGV